MTVEVRGGWSWVTLALGALLVVGGPGCGGGVDPDGPDGGTGDGSTVVVSCDDQPVEDCTGCDDGTTCGTDGDGYCQNDVCVEGCLIGDVLLAAGDVNPINACQVCDPSVSTTAWAPAQDGAACGDEGNLFCREGGCAVACLIEGELWTEGTVNPANGCEVCNPAASSSGWTAAPDGSVCGVDSLCGGGTCGTSCYVDGQSYDAEAVNPANPCEWCDPATPTRWSPNPAGTCEDDGNACTSDTCVAGTCAHEPNPAGTACGVAGTCDDAGQCTEGCSIQGTLYGDGVPHPEDACLICDTTRSQTDWSTRSDGATCPDDGSSCTADVCAAGSCTHPPANAGQACGTTGQVCDAGTCKTGCFIEGVYYTADAANPAQPCQVCDPSASTTAWSPVTAGLVCGEGQFCLLGDCLTGCFINSYTWQNGAQNPDNPCEVCDGARSTSAWSAIENGAICPDDGNDCTADVCDAGSCSHPVTAGETCGISGQCDPSGACSEGCFIDGAFYADGTVNPNNECQVCKTAESTSAWSNAFELMECTDDGLPCTIDYCTSGVCSHTPGNGGTLCGGLGQICAGGACVRGCVIKLRFYEPGTPNPANPCEVCNPDVSTSVWSSAVDGLTCDDGRSCTYGDQCTSGVCTGTSYSCPGNACETTACDGNGGCGIKPNGTTCSASMCTGNAGECQSGVCVPCGGNQANCCAMNNACIKPSLCTPF